MVNSSILFSRRRIMNLIMVSPCFVATSANAFINISYSERLQMALSAVDLSFVQGRLTLLKCHCDCIKGNYTIDAIVRLTWVPGIRQRRFFVSAKEPEDALHQVLEKVDTYFVRQVKGRVA